MFKKLLDILAEWDDLSEDEQYERLEESEGLDDDHVPSGCRACGGPYPYCRDSCPIFDD